MNHVAIENFDEFTADKLKVRRRLQRKFQRKQLIGRSTFEVEKLKEFQDKPRSCDQETRIIAALGIITLCSDPFDETCKIRFDINPT